MGQYILSEFWFFFHLWIITSFSWGSLWKLNEVLLVQRDTKSPCSHLGLSKRHIPNPVTMPSWGFKSKGHETALPLLWPPPVYKGSWSWEHSRRMLERAIDVVLFLLAPSPSPKQWPQKSTSILRVWTSGLRPTASTGGQRKVGALWSVHKIVPRSKILGLNIHQAQPVGCQITVCHGLNFIVLF